MPELGFSDTAEPTPQGDGVVYMFVGADSGIERSDSDVQAETPDGQARADAIVLVRLSPAGTASAVSIPRDMLSLDGSWEPMSLKLLDGPESLMRGVCDTIGVTVDRYVSIDGAGFVDAIDALGGVDVDVDHPVRDTAAELSIERAGRQTIDGTTALALVRSRHPEQLIDGRWKGVSEADGAKQRSAWAATLLDGVRTSISEAGPATLVRTVWSSSDALSLGGGFHPGELQRLSQASLKVSELPTNKIGDGRAILADESSRGALTLAGFNTECVVPH